MRGLAIFQDWFKDFENQYVLIGGTTASIAMTEAGMPFRGTKDLDIVLHVEALTSALGQRFWEFVQAGGYQQKEGNAILKARFQPSLNSQQTPFEVKTLLRIKHLYQVGMTAKPLIRGNSNL